MLYEKILTERNRLEKEIVSLRQKLKSFPDGKIICCRNGNYYKWMLSNEPHKSPVYIPKKNLSFARELTVKKFLTYRMEECEDEMHALDFYLRHHKTSVPKSEQMLTEHPEYQRLLSPHFKPLSQELDEWALAPYEHNDYHPSGLSHKTSSGIYVRSKSEALIDAFLFQNKIPFRYECAFPLGDIVYYPAFTIRHPKTGETIYWEHFGRMDDPKYSKDVAFKLNTYISNGVIPSINLITTYETSYHSLSPDIIQKNIEQYFL